MARLIQQTFRNIHRRQEGAAAVEFAIVASTFLTLMLGVIEYGMIQFTKVQLESAVIQVSRSAGIGNITTNCADRACEMKAILTEKLGGIINPQNVTLTSTVITAPDTASPAIPDICLDDANNPYPSSCSSNYIENGSNNTYNPPTAANAGNTSDMVEIRVTYLWKVLFPILNSYIGNDGNLTLTASTVVKNEPF